MNFEFFSQFLWLSSSPVSHISVSQFRQRRSAKKIPRFDFPTNFGNFGPGISSDFSVSTMRPSIPLSAGGGGGLLSSVSTRLFHVSTVALRHPSGGGHLSSPFTQRFSEKLFSSAALWNFGHNGEKIREQQGSIFNGFFWTIWHENWSDTL